MLFDMDGLLVNCEPVWSVAEAEIMAWLGGPWNLDVKAQCVGRRVDESCRILVGVATSSPRRSNAPRRPHVRAVPRRPAAAAGAAEQGVGVVRAAGIATALVSSSYRALVDAALESFGAHRFDVTVGGDEVTRAKPDPEPYLTAATRLGAHPAVVVEDSAAGAWGPRRPNVVPMPEGIAHAEASSLTDVSVATLAALIG